MTVLRQCLEEATDVLRPETGHVRIRILIENEQIRAISIPISRHHPVARFGLDCEIAYCAEALGRIGSGMPGHGHLEHRTTIAL